MFNHGFELLAHGYGRLATRIVRFAVLMLLVYGGIIAFGLNEFRKTPAGFIPQLDAGYLIVVTQLPSGASLARTDAVNKRVVDTALQVPGVAHAVNFADSSAVSGTRRWRTHTASPRSSWRRRAAYGDSGAWSNAARSSSR